MKRIRVRFRRKKLLVKAVFTSVKISGASYCTWVGMSHVFFTYNSHFQMHPLWFRLSSNKNETARRYEPTNHQPGHPTCWEFLIIPAHNCFLIPLFYNPLNHFYFIIFCFLLYFIIIQFLDSHFFSNLIIHINGYCFSCDRAIIILI